LPELEKASLTSFSALLEIASGKACPELVEGNALATTSFRWWVREIIFLRTLIPSPSGLDRQRSQ
ncbi:MAG: hypothetical protein AB1649_06995, partial [Chloroflexota bacterium]